MDAIRLQHQLSQLQAASENISSVLNPNQVLNVITKEFALLLGAKTVTLSRWEVEINSLVVVSEYEDGDWLKEELGQVFLLTDYSYTELLLKQKEIKQVKINDPSTEPSEQKLLAGYHMKSVLLIPFFKQENLIGLLEVFDDQDKNYDEIDLMMAKLLSSTAAVAFENAKFIQQIEQNFIEQQALHHSASIITSSLDLDTILQKISKEVCSLLDATSVYISNYNPDTCTYYCIAEAFSKAASEAERRSDLGVLYQYRPKAHINAQPAIDQKHHVYDITTPGLDPSLYHQLKEFGGYSVLEIPLNASGKMNAILEVWDSRGKREFSPNEIALCETIALQASIAIENAILYQQAKEELKQRKLLEEEFKHKALHDSLTFLPNRVLFSDRLDQAIRKKIRCRDAEFAVFYIDLDRFKEVNDTYGHLQGDHVLITIANRLKGITRPVDTVSRFGGDEFLILIEGIAEEAVAKEYIARIRHTIGQPIQINGEEILLACSVGCSISSDGLKTCEEYIDMADRYMYSVKHTKKNLFNPISPSSQI